MTEKIWRYGALLMLPWLAACAGGMKPAPVTQPSTIRSLAANTHFPNELYLGTSDGVVLRALEGTAGMGRIGLAGIEVTSLTARQGDSRVLYAGTDCCGLFKLEEQKGTWKTTRLEVPGASIRSSALSKDQDELCVLTEAGLWRSTDGGKMFLAFGEGIPERAQTRFILPSEEINGAYFLHCTDSIPLVYEPVRKKWLRAREDLGFWITFSQSGGSKFTKVDITNFTRDGYLILAAPLVKHGQITAFLPMGDELYISSVCCGIRKVWREDKNHITGETMAFEKELVYSLVRDPQNPEGIIASTSQGLYRMDAKTGTWAVFP